MRHGGSRAWPPALGRALLAVWCLSAPAWAQPPVPALEAQASGVFLNAGGDVLTARHAVQGCASLYVVKGPRAAEAVVVADSPGLDVAVLRTGLKPYLSATLRRTTLATEGSVGVFTEAYGVLHSALPRPALISNAMTLPGGSGLYLLSGVKPGASGSAVLSTRGLLLGMVVERVAAGAGPADRVLLHGAPRGLFTGATQVHAVAASSIAGFLRDNGIVFIESDDPQLGPTQSPSARATTLSVGVVCG